MTPPLLATAAITSLVLGSDTVNGNLNEAANFLSIRAAEWSSQYTPVDVLTIPFTVDQSKVAALPGSKLVVRQYEVGGGELVTTELPDGTGHSYGEVGKVTGIATAAVLVGGGKYVNTFDANNDLISSQFVPDSTNQIKEYTVPISDRGCKRQFRLSIRPRDRMDCKVGLLGIQLNLL